jgi:hypothetical protein
MHRLWFVAAFALAVTQTACMSLSTMQTARTLAPGQSQWTSGTGSYSYVVPDYQADGSSERMTGWYLETSFRYGLTERLDWGGRLIFVGAGGVDLKYQFFDGARFDAAAGAGLGFFHAEIEGREIDEPLATSFLDVVLPVYLSYEISPFVTPYVAPRMVWRKQSEGGGSRALLGVTAGVKIGTTQGVYIEYGYQSDLKSDFSARQFNLAWFWNF